MVLLLLGTPTVTSGDAGEVRWAAAVANARGAAVAVDAAGDIYVGGTVDGAGRASSPTPAYLTRTPEAVLRFISLYFPLSPPRPHVRHPLPTTARNSGHLAS